MYRNELVNSILWVVEDGTKNLLEFWILAGELRINSTSNIESFSLIPGQRSREEQWKMLNKAKTWKIHRPNCITSSEYRGSLKCRELRLFFHLNPARIQFRFSYINAQSGSH